jgi:aminoglycoside 6'-N-acetyltransferase I
MRLVQCERSRLDAPATTIAARRRRAGPRWRDTPSACCAHLTPASANAPFAHQTRRLRSMQIVPFPTNDDVLRRSAAELLVEAFPHENGWPTIELADEEVREALASDRRCRAALDDDGQLLGWIAAIPNYRGRVWELHPLVVRATAHRRGIGRALVQDLERTVSTEGALTLWVGTDDDLGETNLAGVDLYPAPLDHLRALRAPDRHPLGFYLHIGFALAGIVPDANGRGLPGVLLARRLVADTSSS